MDRFERTTPAETVTAAGSGTSRRGGFTLVELMLVVAAAGILAATSISYYGNYIGRAKVQVAVRDIGVLQARIDKYYSDNNAYPSALTDLGLPPSETTDPWGFQYAYINHALVSGAGHIRRDRSLNPLNPDYDLYSVGKDGQSRMPITAAESQDDVLRALGGSYIGLASDF